MQAPAKGANNLSISNSQNSMETDLNDLIVICGGGGFIGGHLVADLMRQGHQKIRAVDMKPIEEWYQRFPGVENLQLDLQDKGACENALSGAAVVYNLAADMGGMGFIENNRAFACFRVDQHPPALGSRKHGVQRYFYSSSACVYTTTNSSKDVVPA